MRIAGMLLCAVGQAAFAGCLQFGEPRAGSACEKSSAELVWLNAPASSEPASSPHRHYDRTIADPALSGGVYFAGDARFELRPPGRHLVEVFLMAMDAPARSSFVLESGGVAVDDRHRARPGPDRLRP